MPGGLIVEGQRRLASLFQRDTYLQNPIRPELSGGQDPAPLLHHYLAFPYRSAQQIQKRRPDLGWLADECPPG